jgi:hypothetical protein
MVNTLKHRRGETAPTPAALLPAILDIAFKAELQYACPKTSRLNHRFTIRPPGHGTILFPGGVAFRAWAPFASSVSAVGTFNQCQTMPPAT